MLLLGMFCLSVRFGVAHLVRLLQDHLKAEAGLANVFFFLFTTRNFDTFW